MEKIIVAAAQIELSKDLDINLKKFLNYLSLAKQKNSSIVVFPETCLYPEFDGLEKKKLDYLLSQIQTACNKLKIFCVAGAYVKENGLVKNAAYLISSKGEILHTHYKTRRWESEAGITCNPASFPVLNTEIGKLGMAICWDISDPNIITHFRQKGAEIILCPSWIPPENTSHFAEAVPLGLAFYTDSFIIFADSLKENFARSCICSPRNFLSRDYDKEVLLIAELDPKNLEEMKSLKAP